MDPNPRQLTLLSVVQAQGSVTVEELAEKLDVTLQTVRRDVQRLADEGLLKRFHGGVRTPGSTIENIAHQQRESLHAEGKARIARDVAAAVPNDCSLILNIGTTTEAIARALLSHSGLRVITNNLNVASILSSNDRSEVIVVARTPAVTGPSADLTGGPWSAARLWLKAAPGGERPAVPGVGRAETYVRLYLPVK